MIKLSEEYDGYFQTLLEHCRAEKFPVVDKEKLKLFCWHCQKVDELGQLFIEAIQRHDPLELAAIFREMSPHNAYILKHADDYLACPMSMKAYRERQN